MSNIRDRLRWKLTFRGKILEAVERRLRASVVEFRFMSRLLKISKKSSA